MTSELPSFDNLSQDDQVTILNTLFEPSPDLHKLVIPFPSSVTSYNALITNVKQTLESVTQDPSAEETLHRILCAHPRLGAKKVESALSRKEQAQLQNGGNEGEAERLAALNSEYEARFPGLRYVVFVNGRGRDVVMLDMRRRIDRGDIRAEEKEAVQAMVDIASDRAKKLGAL